MHLECINNRCVPFGGEGENTCFSVGAACGDNPSDLPIPPMPLPTEDGAHLGCFRGMCMNLRGEGADECAGVGKECAESFLSEYCPYTTGCHLECYINKYRLKAGEGDDIEGVSEGDPCVSPPSEERPSIFNKIISGITRFFYRPKEE